MTETAQHRPRLLIEYAPPAEGERSLTVTLAASDGLVVTAERCPAPETIRSDAPPAVLLCDEPRRYDAWRATQGLIWVGAGGLEQVARLRDEWPEQRWIPRLTVYKPSVTYRFSDEFHGEGFKFYRPDTGAIRGYRVTDGDVALPSALERAKELAFDTVWIHAVDAEILAMGLDLEMLERARRDWRGDLWISGGAAHPKHLENLVREGGAGAVLVPEVVANRCGCEALRAALEPSPAAGVPEAPIRFAAHPGREPV